MTLLEQFEGIGLRRFPVEGEDSVAACMGKQSGEVGIGDIVGKDIAIQKETEHDFGTRTNQDGSTTTLKGLVWRITEIAGAGAIPAPSQQPTATPPPAQTAPPAPDAALAVALQLIENKTDGEFISDASNNQYVKADGQLLASIMSGQFFGHRDVISNYQRNAENRWVKKQPAAPPTVAGADAPASPESM